MLFHELSHASQHMNGTNDCHPEPGWTTAEERRAISTGPPSEADYLREQGYRGNAPITTTRSSRTHDAARGNERTGRARAIEASLQVATSVPWSQRRTAQ